MMITAGFYLDVSRIPSNKHRSTRVPAYKIAFLSPPEMTMAVISHAHHIDWFCLHVYWPCRPYLIYFSFGALSALKGFFRTGVNEYVPGMMPLVLSRSEYRGEVRSSWRLFIPPEII